MNDPIQTYETLSRIVEQSRTDPMEAVKLGLLLAVLVAVSWRLIFAWLHGSASGPEVLVLTVSLIVAETAAIRWLSDFQGARFLLLLSIPVAAVVGVQVIAGVSQRESYRSNLNADIRRFRSALRRDPKNAAARELLGDSYLKLGSPDRALAQYRAAVALDPGNYQNQYKLDRAARLSTAR